jgi:hypothetical protein
MFCIVRSCSRVLIVFAAVGALYRCLRSVLRPLFGVRIAMPSAIRPYFVLIASEDATGPVLRALLPVLLAVSNVGFRNVL